MNVITIVLFVLGASTVLFALAAFTWLRRYTNARIAYIGEKREREYWQRQARELRAELIRVRADLEVGPRQPLTDAERDALMPAVMSLFAGGPARAVRGPVDGG